MKKRTALPFVDGGMTVEQRVDANKAMSQKLNFKHLADMFYRRKAKRMTWCPNRIDGKVVIRPSTWLDIKTRFDPDHVKARLYKRLFSGIAGALSWKDWSRKAAEDKPLPVKAKRTCEYPQPGSPRMTFPPTKHVRPRTARRKQQRQEEAYMKALSAQMAMAT